MKNLYRIAALLLAVLLLLPTVGCDLIKKPQTVLSGDVTAGLDTKEEESADETEAQTEPIELPSAEELALPAITTENYTLSLGVVYLMLENVYDNNISYLAMYGVDTEKRLSEQEYDEGVTWLDYLMDNAVLPSLTQMLQVCEAAKKAGFELSAERAAMIDKQAEEGKSTLADGMNPEDLHLLLTLSAIANDYQDQIYNSFTFEDEKLDAYLKDNWSKLADADEYAMIIDLSELDEDALALTLDKAEAVKIAKDEETYLKAAAEVLIAANDDAGADREQAKEKAKSTQKASVFAQVGAEDWIYDKDRAVGDVLVKYDEEAKTLLLIRVIALPTPDETELIDVRHILALTETYETAEAAHAKAEEWYRQWQDGDATEDSFAALANEVSEDPGSNTKGGLYANVTPGQMVTEFNDWCFDPAREPGDTGIVDTSHGSHVMYFVKTGLVAWKATAENALRSEAFQTYMEKDAGGIKFTTDDAVIAKIDF